MYHRNVLWCCLTGHGSSISGVQPSTITGQRMRIHKIMDENLQNISNTLMDHYILIFPLFYHLYLQTNWSLAHFHKNFNSNGDVDELHVHNENSALGNGLETIATYSTIRENSTR